MDNISVLLCCGAGMSSGFLAQSGRKAVKKRGIEMSIEARSESEVGQLLSEFDIVMIGPHYENHLNEFKEMANPYGIPVVVIPKDIYATLDGNALVDYALETIKNFKK